MCVLVPHDIMLLSFNCDDAVRASCPDQWEQMYTFLALSKQWKFRQQLKKSVMRETIDPIHDYII